MPSKLPYVSQPNLMTKILAKVQEAKAPDRFTTDFLETKLGCKGGNYRHFISLAKKVGLLNSDGTPTDLYKSFRNKSTSGAAMAQALRFGYKEVFDRNEYANSLNKDQLKGLIVEITGLEPKDRVVGLMCQTFEVLRALANFDVDLHAGSASKKEDDKEKTPKDKSGIDREVDLNLSYTINLVLPKTDDPAVFNAIFRSLRENLLRK